MRKHLLAICALIGLLAATGPLSAQVQGVWTSTGSMQSPRELNGQARVSGGNVLAMGGIDSNGNILASAELYIAATGAWALTSGMRDAREEFPAVLLTNGKVLVSGGLGTGGTVLSGAELFDPQTSAWKSAGNLSVARFGHTATLLANGMVLVAGGCTANGCATDTAASEIYDPATNGWSATGSLDLARSYHTAVRLRGGAVLAIGGLAGGASSSTELYDPATGKWSSAASTIVARYQNGTTLLPDGKVLVTGGVIAKSSLNSAEIYDPASNAWRLTGSMTTGRYAHSSTLLSDGTVLLAGGQGQSISCGKACTDYIPTAKAEIYNEAEGKFTATAGLNRAVAYQATTTLASGRALVSGGVGYNAYCCQVVGDAEFYTPLTMKFSPSNLDFGVLQVGLTSGARTVTVANASFHAATFTTITTSGDFSQTNTCPGTLAPGENCAISVSFKPMAAGARNGFVILRDNDPGSPRQLIALTGVGETQALGSEPAAH